MNKYHNRNRIISPIMTIHDILTLHILSTFLPLFIPFLFPFSSSSLSLPFLFPLPLSSLLFSLTFFPPFPLSLSVFSVFYREGRRLSHHPDVERYCARLSE